MHPESFCQNNPFIHGQTVFPKTWVIASPCAADNCASQVVPTSRQLAAATPRVHTRAAIVTVITMPIGDAPGYREALGRHEERSAG